MSPKHWLASLPGIRYIVDLRREIQAMRGDVARLRQTAEEHLGATTAQYADALLREPRYADARHLAHYEWRVHSQGGEDGIIAEVFRRIGTRTRTFVEIGVESGVECTTTLLLRQGWRGWWVEGDHANASLARTLFAPHVASGQLTIIEAMVSSSNVQALLRDAGAPADVDLLSVDIDRNTWHVWHALTALRARATVIEYNASFGPRLDWVIADDPAKSWNGTVDFGASLAACERLGREKGMSLVGCTLNGANAFFVEAALAETEFTGPFTAEALWEPPRYWLRRHGGHPTGPFG
ncbi:MAG: hypothetical protein WC700_19095 [Gemmatimonadaceae bacterium]|jgi:hypothetical protein